MGKVGKPLYDAYVDGFIETDDTAIKWLKDSGSTHFWRKREDGSGEYILSIETRLNGDEDSTATTSSAPTYFLRRRADLVRGEIKLASGLEREDGIRLMDYYITQDKRVRKALDVFLIDMEPLLIIMEEAWTQINSAIES